jgi:hypothetical protein
MRNEFVIIILLLISELSVSQISLIKSIELPKAIIQATYSPDGKNIAVVHANKQIHVFNAVTYELTSILDDKGDGEISIAYSPDGRYLLSGSWDKTLKLWDLNKNKIVKKYYGHLQATRSVCFNPQGNLIASAGWDDEIRFWYVPTAINLKNLSGHTQCVRSIAFSPDGNKIASGGYDQLLKLWDISLGKEIFSVKTSAFPVEALVFNPQGTIIATSGLENNVKLWNATDGTLIKTLKGSTDAVYALAFSPDGKYLATGGNDNIVRIWNVISGICLYQLKGHSEGIRALCFSPNGKTLLSGAVDKFLKIWNVESLNILPFSKVIQASNNISQDFIQISQPNQNPYISTKRNLPISFEVKKNDYNLVQLFLNKYEYTRLINGNKEVVKPLSVKVNYNKNIEINYEIYLDYKDNNIQLVAFKQNTNDFIISPEFLVSYFDLEDFKQKTSLTMVSLNIQKYADKKFNSDLYKDNPAKFINLLKLQEQRLFNKVSIFNIENQDLISENIQNLLDSLALKKTSNDMLLLAIDGFLIQDNSNQKYYLLLPGATMKDFEPYLFPLDNILKTILKTKATAGLFINLSQHPSKLPDNFKTIDDEALNNYIDNFLTSQKGVFFLSLNNPQPLSMFDLLANSMHPSNDVDNNGIVDLNEMSGFLNHLAKIQVFYRPNFIPLYLK